ncbi:MAG TPA: HEAT repeat domain-containing protein [Vicinamibacterales bacterium]|nr:HEAT repeat domain-containing protein [Vicinamibacterales bacterium]
MHASPAVSSPLPPDPSGSPLDGVTAARLTEFARACKAAARVVSLYPAAHPAVEASLGRLVAAAGRAVEPGPFTISVLPNTLLVRGAAPERPDASIGELAALLHDHLIGELDVLSPATPEAWRQLLALLAQAPADVQAQGGIARLWAGAGSGHVRIREVDYAEILRERSSGIQADWQAIIRHCLEDDRVTLDESVIRALLEAVERSEVLRDLLKHLECDAAESGAVAQAQAIARMLQYIADAVAERQPDRLEQVLDTMAQAASQLSPETLVQLLARRVQGESESEPDVVSRVLSRMGDEAIGEFVAHSLVEQRGATERLAEAFQALVPEDGRRMSILDIARQRLEESPLSQEDDFPRLWQQATEMLLSYRDEPFVSESYARELSTARARAADLERIADDPPELIATWLTTITDANLRSIDLQLLLDLLRIEDDAGQWDVVATFVTAHLDDLFLLGDFESAEPLVAALAAEAELSGRPSHRTAALAALDRTRRGQLMMHLPGHLRTIDDAAFERARRICVLLGTALIRPLAEALAVEDRGRAFRRLTDLLTAFGPAGREAVEQLKASPNPAVRRTAIYLLREFGGQEALPELTSLLEDSDPNIQRDAVRAIALIGTPAAYDVLFRALASGSAGQRSAIVNALGSMRDVRAIPLFCHMVRSPEYRRSMHGAYLAALEGLGAVGGPEAVAALDEALRQGEWYRPFRTAALRRAAAAALRRIGSREALAVLERAAEQGSHGVRAIAREQLALAGPLPTSKAGAA